MGKIYCFMGKSASGKDTLFNEVKKNFPNIENIILYTTRPIRDNEEDGKDYYFVSETEYLKLKEDDLIIEERSYNTKCGIWRYFTSNKNIDLVNNNYFMINTLVGYKSLVDFYGDDTVVPIYIWISDDMRLERALERERKQEVPKYDELCRRFLADQKDFSEENLNKLNIPIRFNNTSLQTCSQYITLYINNDINLAKKKEITL